MTTKERIDLIGLTALFCTSYFAVAVMTLLA